MSDDPLCSTTRFFGQYFVSTGVLACRPGPGTLHFAAKGNAMQRPHITAAERSKPPRFAAGGVWSHFFLGDAVTNRLSHPL
jgi:hypothetical protein